MQNIILKTGCLLGALAVTLGAFGAHGLKSQVSEKLYHTFQTGVSYHFYHVFAILIIGVLYQNITEKFAKFAFLFFAIGILLFSGSLYLLATRTLLGIEHWTWLGPLTPIGGVFFILGWILLACAKPLNIDRQSI